MPLPGASYLPGRRTGQILNYSSLANDCGIALDTAKRWISVLKAGFIVFLLPPLYFWRDRTGHEVDLLLDDGGKLFPVEIKSGQTISPSMFDSLNWWCTQTGVPRSSATLVYGGSDYQKRDEIAVRPWYSV
ncbi:MAG: DUF4143 domain-containing protein [Spirochaetota bacterium]